MAVVQVEIWIRKDIRSCFDAARDIHLHTQTVWNHTREEAIGGVTSGPIGSGETVTFRATHLGVRQRLTSKIVELESPYLFVDEMQRGAFKSLRHIHQFIEHEGGTLMKDTLEFRSPLGIIGRAFDFLVLERYMKNFLVHRNLNLKKILEHPGDVMI